MKNDLYQELQHFIFLQAFLNILSEANIYWVSGSCIYFIEEKAWEDINR